LTGATPRRAVLNRCISGDLKALRAEMARLIDLIDLIDSVDAEWRPE
jgi:hypothetical protein